jgi:HK97 family phage major capsid protein
MVLVAAGAQTVPMVGKTQTHAALTADPTATWHSENAADITASDPTFAARTLNAQTIVSRCTASIEVTQDSPNFGEQLAGAMTAAIAQEIDRVGLVGTGTAPQPRGLLNTAGVGEVLSVGTIADYSKMLTGVQTLLEANLPLEVATGTAIMSPRSWSRFEALATGISGDKTQLPRPRALENTRFLVTSAVPNDLDTNKSAIFLGDFRDLVMGIRTDTQVKALEIDTFASRLQIEFVAYSRVDFVATRPASFCVLRGVA